MPRRASSANSSSSSDRWIRCSLACRSKLPLRGRREHGRVVAFEVSRRAVIARLGARLPLDGIALGARLLVSMPLLLRYRISPEQARTILAGRFERRQADFLDLARAAI